MRRATLGTLDLLLGDARQLLVALETCPTTLAALTARVEPVPIAKAASGSAPVGSAESADGPTVGLDAARSSEGNVGGAPHNGTDHPPGSSPAESLRAAGDRGTGHCTARPGLVRPASAGEPSPTRHVFAHVESGPRVLEVRGERNRDGARVVVFEIADERRRHLAIRVGAGSLAVIGQGLLTAFAHLAGRALGMPSRYPPGPEIWRDDAPGPASPLAPPARADRSRRPRHDEETSLRRPGVPRGRTSP